VDPKPLPLVPSALPLRDALDRNSTLQSLRQRLQDSAARLGAIVPLLPPPLRDQVCAGPVDETGWSLLAQTPAAAAKLRQLRPRLEQALFEAGWQVSAIRIKVQPRQHPA
jgi:hypothetical protein